VSIDVSGGAGGVGAAYQDILSEARVLDDAGDGLRARSADVATMALDESVVASALLCPATAARAGLALGAAAVGPQGLLPISIALEGSALCLRATVEAYQFLDETQKGIFDAIHVAGGFALGAALPFLAVGAAGLALANPQLTATLGAIIARNPKAFENAALTKVFENPWLMEDAIAIAPGLLQGAAITLTGGLAVPSLLSGGRWPTAGYENAVAGLVTTGNTFGVFKDSGKFRVVPADTKGAAAPTSVADIFREQGKLGDSENHGQIQISTVVGTDGVTSHIVQIPGTQDSSLTRGDNPIDMTTNLKLMSGQDTVLQAQVARAMKDAGIGPSDPVMLTGHSQGGIACAAMASDPAFRKQFNVTGIVTGGSPIARFDIPADVSVLSLEHKQDLVPMLEGRENPDRANWVTVKRDVSADVATNAAKGGTPGVLNPLSAHDTDIYATTGAQIDSSKDPSLAAWEEQNAVFFRSGGTVSRYQIQPVAP